MPGGLSARNASARKGEPPVMAEQNDRDGMRDGGGGGSRRTPPRGFASMDRERQREIASKGGRAAHAKGTAHEWTADEARSAGRKGGETVSRDREHMAAIGREGGGARSANARGSMCIP